MKGGMINGGTFDTVVEQTAALGVDTTALVNNLKAIRK